MPDKFNFLISNKEELLRFLKPKVHLYHQSNVFFRDFQYGIISFAESKGLKLRYDVAEDLAKQFLASLERSGILRPIKPGSWMLNYPEFKKPSAKPEVSAKPTAAQVAGTAKGSAVPTSASAGSSAQPSNG